MNDDRHEKPTVTILDDYQSVALASADWVRVQDQFAVEVIGEHIADEAELVRRLRRSQVIVAMRERTPFPARVLSALPELRLLVTTGMGNAAIDVEAAQRQGVTVCGTRGAGNAMPELVMGMIIALTRNFAQEDAAMRTGGWQHTIGPGLYGRTLGILGLGRLGQAVAGLAHAFGLRVIAWSPHLTPERAAEHDVRAVSKRELFAESDVLTVHLKLSDTSRGLVGADDLALMKPSAYLVNTSRGPIVDEPALLDALRSRRIAGAGLDVYDVEPLPADHPLRSLHNTLLLPHIGYVTTDGYEAFYSDVVEDVLAWTQGAPIRLL
jgi:phosphoglycerate dehydrogenase-like enzyme